MQTESDDYRPVSSQTGESVEMRALALGSASSANASGGGAPDAFPVTVKQLQDLVDPKNKKKLAELGGIVGVVGRLRTDPKRGLSTSEVDTVPNAAGELAPVPFGDRRAQYGENRLPAAESTPFWRLVWEALQDRTLIILIIAAVISIAIGIYDEVHNQQLIRDAEANGTPLPPTELGHWVEGVAIMVAVIVVVLVNSINDYQKEKQFRKLNSRKEDREVNVVRDGEQCQISVFDLVVGDVCAVAYGDVLPADGLLVEGRSVRCDESGLTGESDAIKKTIDEDPFLLSGTKVLEGQGYMVVIGVGIHSLNGKTMMALRTETEDTPLQVKLGELAESTS
jgi:P-type Ca2+ transporter type 2C